ncbi:MAG: radical SAM protein [Thermodesulfobacteriota bacterium]|nr:radical SAM protein [Thermodesulfobacteriota bacterium]
MSEYVVKQSIADLMANKSPVLRKLDIELTERCNNNCIHCYINQPANDRAVKNRELTTETLKHHITEAAALGCMTLRLTGGEPLLRHDLPELYRHARSLGIAVALCTNATLITPALADLFQSTPPGAPVEITLYGINKDNYEVISNLPGSYKAAMAGIQFLRERDIAFTLKGCYIREHFPDHMAMAAFEQVTAELTGSGQPPGFSMNFDLRARRMPEKKNEMIRSLRATPAETLMILTRDNQAFIKEMKQFAAKFMRPPGSRLFSCGAGKNGAIDAYGMLQPCLMMRHPDMVYDLSRGTLKDGMTRFFPALRKKEATNPDYLARCARCFLHGLCEQCPAKSWMEHGTLDTPVEYLCAVAHEKGRYLGLLHPGETAWTINDWQQRLDAFSTE